MDTTIDPQPHPHQANEPGTIVLDHYALEHLRETRKWTNFVSIAAFVMIGLMFIGGIILMTGVFSSPTGVLDTTPVSSLIILTVLYAFPVYNLYQFSKFAKKAVDEYDALALGQALRYLKMHYRLIASLLFIMFGLYVIVGFALLSGRLTGMFG